MPAKGQAYFPAIRYYPESRTPRERAQDHAHATGVDLRVEAPEWQERSLCSQTDPEAFFPEKGGSTREAKQMCSRCPVKGECLEYALGHDERFGIWGGLSERERRKVKRRNGQGPVSPAQVNAAVAEVAGEVAAEEARDAELLAAGAVAVDGVPVPVGAS
jgi:WhiB family redox-sensing transcriptional regulator